MSKDSIEYQLDIKLLGETIRNLRKSKRMSQEELAFRSDITNIYLNKLEMGNANPAPETLIAIARALDVTIDFLLFNQPSKEEKQNVIDEILEMLDQLSLVALKQILKIIKAMSTSE